MPRSLTPPRKSHHRARRARSRFLELRRDHALLGQVPPGLLSARMLHALPVYTLELPLPQTGTSLCRAARRTAWLYFLQHKSRAAALEVGIQAGQHRHPRLHQGASIDALLRHVRRVKRRRGAVARGTHLRLLRIDALHLSCIWLRGPVDTLIPVNALEPYLAEGTAYSLHEFLARVADASRMVPSLHAKPARRPGRA